MFLQRRFWHGQRFGGGPARKGEPDYAAMSTPVAEQVCGDAVWIPQQDLLAPRGDVRGIADAVARLIEHADQLRDFVRRRRKRGRQ